MPIATDNMPRWQPELRFFNLDDKNSLIVHSTYVQTDPRIVDMTRDGADADSHTWDEKPLKHNVEMHQVRERSFAS